MIKNTLRYEKREKEIRQGSRTLYTPESRENVYKISILVVLRLEQGLDRFHLL